ncbi:uncharacterized protein LOC143298266 [Babylonia areolata]|uniref:uncharacterized protein LOC143298266 n=1 Tax=Babylonia areolata TaxID=304850 RepID=UPI003FCEF301
MEQLNSMFTRLKRGLYAGGDYSQPPEKQQSLRNSCSASDDEGFVLIGENEGSETMVFPSTPEKVNGQDAERTGGDSASSGHLDMDCVSSPDAHDYLQGITCHPAVVGVPFQINPKLLEKDRLQSILSKLNLETARFDWQKYSYDFHFEQSSLQELCTMEERTVWADCRNGT